MLQHVASRKSDAVIAELIASDHEAIQSPEFCDFIRLNEYHNDESQA